MKLKTDKYIHFSFYLDNFQMYAPKRHLYTSQIIKPVCQNQLTSKSIDLKQYTVQYVWHADPDKED